MIYHTRQPIIVKMLHGFTSEEDKRQMSIAQEMANCKIVNIIKLTYWLNCVYSMRTMVFQLNDFLQQIRHSVKQKYKI